MKKNDVKLVDRIQLTDRRDFVEFIAGTVFSIDEDGMAAYRPWMFDEAFELGFYLYAIEGIEFEVVESDGGTELEDIIGVCRADEEVRTIFEECMRVLILDDAIHDQLWSIREEAHDLIRFRQDEYIAQRKDVIGELALGLGQIGRLIASIDFEKIDSNIIVQSLITSFEKQPEFANYLMTVGDWTQRSEETNENSDNRETNQTEIQDSSDANTA